MPSSTRRRTIVGTGALLAGLGGCLGFGDRGPESATETATSEPPTVAVGDRRRMGESDEHVFPYSEDVDIVERVEVVREDADRSGDLYVEPVVFVWNDGPERTVRAFVRGAESGTHLDETFDLGTDEGIELQFRGRDEYLVSIGIETQRPYATVVGRDRFHCNESQTTVRLGESGEATESTVRTAMACPNATPM